MDGQGTFKIEPQAACKHACRCAASQQPQPERAAKWNKWACERMGRCPHSREAEPLPVARDARKLKAAATALRCADQCGAALHPRNRCGFCRDCIRKRGFEILTSGHIIGFSQADNRAIMKTFADLAKGAADAPERLQKFLARRNRRYEGYKRPTRAKAAAQECVHRNCLGCGNDFTAETKFIRMCGGCKNSAAWAAGADSGYSTGMRHGARSDHPYVAG